MKPLKDIGLVLTIDATTNGDFESSLLAAGDHFDNGKLNTVYAYSLQDRRELVREAIVLWERQAYQRDQGIRLVRTMDMELFLKSEGI